MGVRACTCETLFRISFLLLYACCDILLRLSKPFSIQLIESEKSKEKSFDHLAILGKMTTRLSHWNKMRNKKKEIKTKNQNQNQLTFSAWMDNPFERRMATDGHRAGEDESHSDTWHAELERMRMVNTRSPYFESAQFIK